MTENKVSSPNVFTPRAKKASVTENGTPLRKGDVISAGDIRSFEFEDCSGKFGVVLQNKDPGSPGRARSALGNIRIADLLPDSRAKQDGKLTVGDRVLEINGHDLSKASLERARWYLSSALRSGKLKIQVLHSPTESNITPLTNGVVSPVERTPDASKPGNMVKKIHILKDSRGLGVQISMKLNRTTGEKGVFVSDVSPGGAAARDGRLKDGDELLWINGHSLIGVTQQEAVDLLRASPKLIQLVISTEGSESSSERKAPSRGRSETQENVHRKGMNHVTRTLPRAASVDNLLNKARKKSLDYTEKKSNITDKRLEKATTRSNNPDIQQLQENGPSRITDHRTDDHSPVKNNHNKQTDLVEKSYNEQNNPQPLNGNVSSLTNGRRRSSSGSSVDSIGPSMSNSGDVLLSKAEESLDSEPMTLEDKPLPKGSAASASARKVPSSPVMDAAKKRNLPNLLLNTSKEKVNNNSRTNLEPGQISPSLPRPQSPGGMGIAFSARYLGEPPSNVMTIAVPTPLNFVGSNERDSPQAKRKGSYDNTQRRHSKGMEEEIVTIVLVKGMSGKGLGFTIVGGKGSPHGDLAVYVKNILPGGAAEADGRMKRGDEVLSVNGTAFQGFTHQQALDTFKNLRRGIVTLKVKRNSPGAPSLSTFTTPRSTPGSSRRNSKDVTADSSSSNNSSPTMFRKLRQKRSQKEKTAEVVLYKEPGNSLGIGLGERNPSTQQQGIFVQCVIEGTPAANDGRLRQGDKLLEINDMKLEGLTVEKVYSILDKVPPGKVYIKVIQSDASEKLPLQLNDALTKLQSERQLLDKKMSVKSKSVGTASTLSGASASSDSCDNMTSLSSSCDLLIPLSAEPNKKKKSQALQESDDAVFTEEPDVAEYLEDIYTVIKQPTGELGMGVTIDKSRGNTIVEGVSIKSVTEGGSAALAKSPRGVGLKLGDQIVEVNGTHLRGMDQEDVIKIFRDLPSSTQMKIRRSRMVPRELDFNQNTNKRKESIEKEIKTQETPVPLPKPPEGRRRSSQRGRVQPLSMKTDVIPSSEQVKAKAEKVSQVQGSDVIPSSEQVKSKEKKDSRVQGSVSKELYKNGSRVTVKAQERTDVSGGAQTTPESQSTEQVKPILDGVKTSKDLKNTKSDRLKDELGDNLIIPSGYRKVTLDIKKTANSTLGLSLVPSYGKLKGYFQIRRLLSGMVCAQDGQLHIGDKLVSVNGVSLKGVTHSMALQLLKKPMELVTFVILREGVETQEKVSSTSNFAKAESSVHNSTIFQDKGVLNETETPLPLKTDSAEKLHSAEQPMASIGSQQNNESKNFNKLHESQSVSSEDETSQEIVPEVPCTPPPSLPSPLLGVDHILHSDVCIPPPSFSPPPPPLPAAEVTLSTGEDDVSISSFPVVSPPPDLSPRMKEFMEHDLFRTEDHQDTRIEESTHHDEILPESSLKQASAPRNEADVGWDFQSLLEACNDLNTYEKDVLTSEQSSITEAQLVPGDLKPKISSPQSSVLPSETRKISKESDLGKLIDTHFVDPVQKSTGTSSVSVGIGKDLMSDQSWSKISIPGLSEGDKGRKTPVKGRDITKDITRSISPLHSKGSSECEIDDDVKPVAGRRVENVPFVITYQKKFRSLGIKVDLSGEGKVVVTDVSSFGLVGKDGNIRVGDVVMSINDTPLEGMNIEDVQNMIKNCPRGDVRIVAQAGPKLPKQIEETVSLPDRKEHDQLQELKHSKSKAEGNTLPGVLLNSAIHKPQVDIPSELISQEISGISSKTVTNLSTSKTLQGAEPIILLQERPEDLITTEECETVVENSEVSEDTDFDDLPPPIPPPPVPTHDLQVESSSVIVDEPLVQGTVQDVSLNPPTDFDDFFDDHNTNVSPLFYDSDMDGPTQTPDFTYVDSKPHDHSIAQKKEESFNKTDVSSSSGQEMRMSSKDMQPQIPIKPPSLFGDDTESIPPALPRKFMKNSVVEEIDAIASPQWNGLDNAAIKPPSLFDDELESLPSLPRAPPPPKLDKQFISLDTISSNSSSPVQSPWFGRESPNHSPKTRHSNISGASGSSSPSRGNNSTIEIVDPFSDVPIQPPDVPDDDMSSLPPAPPPPRSRSQSSDAVMPLPHGNEKVPRISSPIPHPVRPERKSSKKRILPLRIRSKKGRKTSEQSDASFLGDGHRESLPQSSQLGFGAAIISSDVNQPLAPVEPPEDDMESLPPAPPPPRMSPLTVENLENIADGLQPMNGVQRKPHPSHLASDEHRAVTPTDVESLHSSQHSPKKKKKSFRRNVVNMEEKESLPESTSSSTNIPSTVPETDLAVDSSLTHLSPLEDEVAVTDSSDAMSPPPLPPEMELWSEAGSAEAELALLDQILTLEDSSRSGSSEGGSSSSARRPSLSKDFPSVDKTSIEIKEGPLVSKSEKSFDQSESIMSKEGSSETNTATSSLQELRDIETGRIPELEPMKSNSSFNMTDANEDSESDSAVVEESTSESVHHKLSRMLLKQTSEGKDMAGNLMKQRRPAPPIPTRPAVNNKASSLPRKSLPGGLGIAVLPSRPDIKPKAGTLPHQPTPKHQKEQHKLSSPVKEKTSKKLFSKSHKGKDKRADPNNLESPDASFESNPDGRERSRSWTKKLFGFRSRSKSRDKSKDQENRSRSVSPPRGLFSKSRRSSPPPPPPGSPKKGPLGKHKKRIEKKDIHLKETTNIPVLSPAVPSAFELNNPASMERHNLEGNNNKFSSQTTYDEELTPVVDDNVLNYKPNTVDVISTVQDESYLEETEVENVYLDYEVNDLSESEKQGRSLSVEDDDARKPDVHFGMDASLTNRQVPPPPPPHEKPVDATVLTSNVDEKEQCGVEERVPKNSPSKPPVPKRPAFLKLVNTPNTQQQRTVEELKHKLDKASSCEDKLETALENIENFKFNTDDEDVQESFDDNEDLPSPGPPTFKPVPPPLALQTNTRPDEWNDLDETAGSPNSPGPPQFKPLPPPLDLKAITVQNDVKGDKSLDPPKSPGPPRFKPAPPPIDLRVKSKDIDSEPVDVPSTADLPNVRPLPPIPTAAGMMLRQKETFSVKQNVAPDRSVENDAIPEQQNDERRKTKPLPPIPTGFNLKTKDDNLKLPLSRQDAQEIDTNEDILEQKSDLSHVLADSTEDNNYSQVSQVAEPLIVQNSVDPVNASNSDDFDSELSSEWDDTCSSTQDEPGLSTVGNKFVRSASFSAGDLHVQRPLVVDEPKKRFPPVTTMRPPPLMRRRSSSLPQLFPELLTGAASEGGAGETDYWHTGNLQQLINSRNQELDVDEGILEVQLLKEQQSIGLMVVGGLDTHLGMLYIKNIQPNSPAANCNRLRTGDQLLQVNDNCLVGVTHGEALNILKNTPPLVKLTVARKKNSEGDGVELVAEGRRVADFEEPIVSTARESSTISKTSSELSLSPPADRGQRPKSVISLSSFGTSFHSEDSPTSPNGSLDELDEYVPAYLEPESPTLNLRHDDVPVTIIDGIPGETDDTTDEEEIRAVGKSVSWAVSSDNSEVFTVELVKSGRAGLGLSVSGGVDTPHDDIMVRQILSSSVTAHNGLIKKGDILLSVNGKSFKGLTNTEALTLLKDTPDRVTLVVSRPLGAKQHAKAMTLLRNKNANREIMSDSEAWPTKDELTKKKNLANTNTNTTPTLEKIPLDLTKQNGEHSTFDRLKKRLFSNGGSMSLKERLHKAPQGPSVTEITLEKGASGLGFSLGGGQDSMYGDAPIHVRYVFKESVAGRSGVLKPGDEILEVNGQKVAYMSNVDVLELIRRLPYGPVVMKIRRQ